LILLIHPPVSKPGEPPAGIARLSGLLDRAGIGHRLLDANIEGLLHLARTPLPAQRGEDTWTKRAVRDLERNLASLKGPDLYRNIDRYCRAVRDLERVLGRGTPTGTAVGLANFRQQGLLPVRSRDLLFAAEHPEQNPFYPYFRTRLLSLFRQKEPRIAGLSVNYLSQALCAFSMAGFLRREFPGLQVILGGGLVTSWLKNPCWENRFSGLVDRFVSGPGEDELLRIASASRTAAGTPGAGDASLPPDERPRRRSCAWPGPEVSRPDYAGLPLDRYLSPGFILPYSASAGCYWNRCAFCPEKAEGNPYRPVPAREAVSDLAALSEQTAPVLMHLLDNAVSPALLDALCAQPPGPPWYGFARVDRRLGDPDFCRALKRAGCVLLKLGIESGDPAVLQALHKGATVEEASAALTSLKQAGIATYVYLLFGTPEETESSARKTLSFTVGHGDRIDFLNLAIFNMPVCGRAEPEIETSEFYEGDLSLYTGFSHPSGWDRKRVRLFLDREFKRHPAVSAILKNDPPVFTSNHAPFFAMNPLGSGRCEPSAGPS
jgi:hypothetical protein